MSRHSCRLCRGVSGTIVLDLGDQPACDHFPPAGDPGPDPRYPLQMWLCSDCGLAQLVDDPTDAEEPRGVEPAALIAQSADAVRACHLGGMAPTRQDDRGVRKPPWRFVAAAHHGARAEGRRWATRRPMWSSTVSD